MDKHWHFDHLLWPWPWKQQTNLSARHAGSWWWITIPSLVTKCLLAFRYHLDKHWRLTFAVILTLIVVTNFSKNTLAYDAAPPHQVWKQNVLWFRRYHPDKHSLTFWITAVALTLNAVIHFFPQDTPAYDAVLSKQVWLQTDQQFRWYSRNGHILII